MWQTTQHQAPAEALMGAKTDILSVMSDLLYMLGKCLCPALESEGVEIALPLSQGWIWQPQGGACHSSLALNHASRCLTPRDSPPWPPGLVSHLPAGLVWWWPGPHTWQHTLIMPCAGTTGTQDSHSWSTPGTQRCHIRVHSPEKIHTCENP